jgi:hypothetical protein
MLRAKTDPVALPLTEPVTYFQTEARNNLVSEPSLDMSNPSIDRMRRS